MRSDFSLNSIMVGATTARVGDMAAMRVARKGGRGSIDSSIDVQRRNIRHRGCCCSVLLFFFFFFLTFRDLAADQHGVRLRISQLRVQNIVNPARCAAQRKIEYHIYACWLHFRCHKHFSTLSSTKSVKPGGWICVSNIKYYYTFVIFSQFNKARAGLTIVQSKVFGLATNTLSECEKQQQLFYSF